MFVQTKMTAAPFTVTPDTSVVDAAELMTTSGVRNLVVVDGRSVVGVLSRGDLKQATPSKATTLSAGEINYLLAKLKVSRVMTKEPLTISPDALLEEAAVLMRDNKVEILPVVREGALVGVITESDIMDAFIDILGFKKHGTRLTITVSDIPGVMEKIGAITERHQVNVTNVAVYHGADHATVVLGLNSRNTQGLEADLEAEGFKIIYRLSND